MLIALLVRKNRMARKTKKKQVNRVKQEKDRRTSQSKKTEKMKEKDVDIVHVNQMSKQTPLVYMKKAKN